MKVVLARGFIRESPNAGEDVVCHVTPITLAAAKTARQLKGLVLKGVGRINDVAASHVVAGTVLVDASVELEGPLPSALEWKLVSCERRA